MKILHIGDLHFGEKGNSSKFNLQILTFLRWAVEQAKDRNVDLVVQHGDYFHTRHEINSETLHYGLLGAEVLAEVHTIALLGNHDLYYLERLDVSSLNALKNTITVIDSPTQIEDVLIVPWVANGEIWEQCVKNEGNVPYLLGHFEFNGFKVNDGYRMEHGLNSKSLRGYKRVISGHYHSIQTAENVTYIGTPYPITMSEANEPHGIFVLDTDTDELEFIQYDGIKVVSVVYTQLDEVLSTLDDPENTSIRVEFPSTLEDETLISDITKKLMTLGFSEIKTKYTAKKTEEILSSVTDLPDADNIDDVVLSNIAACADVAGVDKTLLGEIYQLAIEKAQI